MFSLYINYLRDLDPSLGLGCIVRRVSRVVRMLMLMSSPVVDSMLEGVEWAAFCVVGRARLLGVEIDCLAGSGSHCGSFGLWGVVAVCDESGLVFPLFGPVVVGVAAWVEVALAGCGSGTVGFRYPRTRLSYLWFPM